MTTKIPWVKNPDGSQGITLNLKTGCLNHDEGLCKGGGFPCYAYRLAKGRLRTRYCSNRNIIRPDTATSRELYDPFYPRWWPDRLLNAYKLSQRTRHGIFLDDMADWMGDYWPKELTRAELDLMRARPGDWFYTLTKQPQNLHQWSPFPDNCWVGVTATNRDAFNNAVWHLMSIEAKIKYISIEPLLSPITAGILDNYHNWPVVNGSILSHVLDQVIIGAQTKPKRIPQWKWVRDVIEACDKAGVSVFLKDNLGLPRLSCEGATPFYKKHPSGTMELRQEVPGVG